MSRSGHSLFGPLASAVLLYLFLVGFQVAAAAVVPWLLELWERSPRLGALAWLALLTGPAWCIALAHRMTHRAMNRLDRGAAGAPASIVSLRAGLFGWFAISFSSLASAFLLLAIFPPPPEEETLSALVRVATDVRLQAGMHALLWVSVAAILYRIEAIAGRSAPTD